MTQHNIPNLRFPEFSEIWEEKKIENIIISYKLGGNYSNTENPTNYPLIKMGNLDRGYIKINKIEYIPEQEEKNDDDIIKYGDLFFNTRNTLDLVGKVAIWKNELPVAYFNSNLMRIEFKDNFFMNYRLNSVQGIIALRRLATGTTSVAAIYTKDFLKIKLHIPSLPEQQKIASFLSAVDKKIEQLQKKKELLEQYKKGMMQKLFSREIRFKDDNGKVFPEWEEKELLEVVNFVNGKAHEQNISENGKYIVINSKFISSNGTIQKFSDQQICPVKKDDIVMVMSDVPNGKALSKCYYVLSDNLFTLNQRICLLRSNSNVYPKFLFYIINRNKYYLAFDSGVGQTNLKKEDVLTCPLFIPNSLKEQTKIADFLTAIDDKVALIGKELEGAKTFKKGLLQQMFV